MTDIRVDAALWASAVLPEGLVTRWYVTNGADIVAGSPIAELQIEGALHEVIAPATGRIAIVSLSHSVIEPGSLLATLQHDENGTIARPGRVP